MAGEESRHLLDEDETIDNSIPYTNYTRRARNSSHSSTRNPRFGYLAAVVILFVELAERMTYYGLICNIVLFCTSELNYYSVDAVTINLTFTSISYFLPVIGGYISDVFCGYFNTLYAAGLVYVTGSVMFIIVTFDFSVFGEGNYLDLTWKRILFFIGLSFISIGTGGIKSNVGPFGAEQLSDSGPNATQTFFTWFYWFINVGAFIAYSLIAYIQQEISFFVGFIIPTSSMIVAVILLVAFKRIYRINQPQGSVLPKIFHIIKNSMKVKKYSIVEAGTTLDYARKRNGGRYDDNDVDDVISIVGMLPIFTCCIIFWIVYNQMSSTFFLQGERLDVRIGQLNLPAASLNLFDAATILLLAPLMDRVVYPLMDRLYHRPSQLVRIGFGMILASLSMLVGGILEIYRKEDIRQNGPIDQVLAGQHFNASSLSVLTQVPQFMLIGGGEIFLVISGQEFAFSEAPESLKSAVMGLFLITNGIGSLLGSLSINIVNAISAPNYWFPDDVNNGYMENYCFLLAGIMFANFLLYIPVARRYQYTNLKTVQYQIRFRDNKNKHSPDDSDEEVSIRRGRRGILES